MWTDQVGSQRLQVVQQYGGLLVPVGIQLDPSLLHEYARELLKRIESVARQVGFHASSLTGINDADVQAGGGIFSQAGCKIRGSLRLIQIVKNSHFGFVVRAGGDLFGAGECKLAITGRAVTQPVELRLDAQLLAREQLVSLLGSNLTGRQRRYRLPHQIRLALIAPRSARSRRNITEAHTPL